MRLARDARRMNRLGRQITLEHTMRIMSCSILKGVAHAIAVLVLLAGFCDGRNIVVGTNPG